MINLYFEDLEYPKPDYFKDRKIARAVVLEDDKILILKVSRNDQFGNSTYLETPGGGIDEVESEEEALKRELDEELGVSVKIITKLGIVTDYYNLLNRRNINNYYLVKVLNHTKIHHESDGDNLIECILKLSIEDVLEEYKKTRKDKISRLVYQREEPIFLEALKYLSKD